MGSLEANIEIDPDRYQEYSQNKKKVFDVFVQDE
jgi:hypothetical protein